MVSNVLKAEKLTLGGEAVVFDQGDSVLMVLGQHREEVDIYGGARKQLSVNGSASFDEIPAYVTEGTKATFRGIDWKVESVERGQAVTSVSFVDQNRIEA